ncbi:MAG: hypothetical protein K0U68_10180 [Gammaproteobacteria bacterium]|nr:hypothetical protein [Gammaproteobacteria bacterium]
MTVKIALLSNPKSGRHAHLSTISQLVADETSIRHIKAENMDQFQQFVEQLIQDPVDIIAINSGDGTIHALLTLLLTRLEHIPVVALLKGGTTNMTAGDVGIKGSNVCATKKLIKWLNNPQRISETVSRPVLKIEWDSTASPQCGMFFGVGAIIQGQDYFHAHVVKKGLRDSIGPALSALRIFMGMCMNDQTVFTPSNMDICGFPTSDQSTLNQDPVLKSSGLHILAFASSLERLFLGIRPFWGPSRGKWHLTAVGYHPDNYSLFRLLPFFRGKPTSQMISSGYHSARVNQAVINIDGEFTIDGERYTTHPGHNEIRISHAGNINFLQL